MADAPDDDSEGSRTVIFGAAEIEKALAGLANLTGSFKALADKLRPDQRLGVDGGKALWRGLKQAHIVLKKLELAQAQDEPDVPEMAPETDDNTRVGAGHRRQMTEATGGKRPGKSR